MGVKTRTGGKKTFQAYHYRRGNVLANKPVTYVTSAQSVASDGHAIGRLGQSNADIGGGFTNLKVELHVGEPVTMAMINFPGAPVKELCTALALPPGFNAMVQQFIDLESGSISLDSILAPAMGLLLSDSSMDAAGAQLVNSCKPTNPTVDLATTLAEFLSERKFFSLPGKAGSVEGEYLNYMFGVAPTVSAAQDLRTAIRDKDEILQQFRRDRGKRIRRRALLDGEVESSTTISEGKNPAFIGALPSSECFDAGQLRISTTIRRRTWFSGAFTYYYPDEGFGKTLAELDRLYGVKPDVGTAWELIPFSWLADYKLSTGAAISNMASFSSDGLVMQYGYVMRETIKEELYSWKGQLNDVNSVPHTVVLEGRKKTTVQQRRKANPFGFGINPGSLSTRQKSILAALASLKVRGR